MALDGTYSGLKTSVADFLHRADLTAQIPDFITLFEAFARTAIHAPEQESGSGAVTVAAGASTGTLPTDFLMPRDATITIGSSVVGLKFLTPTVMRRLYPDQAAGYPRAYTIIGNTLKLDRPTDTAYTITLDYFAAIAALTVAAPTNWLLTKYPNLYLFGTLLQSAPYLGADNRIQTWSAFVTTAVDGINLQGMLQGYGAPIEARVTSNVA